MLDPVLFSAGIYLGSCIHLERMQECKNSDKTQNIVNMIVKFIRKEFSIME
jgi:ribosomal protein L31E